MDLDAYFDAELDEHEAVVAATRALKSDFIRLAEISEAAINGGNKLVFFGNGGSAGDAQHLATELVCRYKVNRKALPAIAFTTDTSLLTAAANDFGYETVFSRQVEALCRPGDVAIALSGSGNSPNIVKALEYARSAGIESYAILGFSGGKALALADHPIHVAVNDMQLAEDAQIIIGHLLMQWLSKKRVNV